MAVVCYSQPQYSTNSNGYNIFVMFVFIWKWLWSNHDAYLLRRRVFVTQIVISFLLGKSFQFFRQFIPCLLHRFIHVLKFEVLFVFDTRGSNDDVVNILS